MPASTRLPLETTKRSYFVLSAYIESTHLAQTLFKFWRNKLGRPFSEELTHLKETYSWANSIEIDQISEFISSVVDDTVYIVGSGGSFSGAAYAAYLARRHGLKAQALTPLGFRQESISRNSSVIFISAGGSNVDVMRAYQYAVSNDVSRVAAICMSNNTKLNLAASANSIGKVFEYSPPYGKDGFLSTNSLVAYFVIFARLFDEIGDKILPDDIFDDSCFCHPVEFEKVLARETITVLHSSYGSFAAIDFESKCSEAALAVVQLADYRNFAHGRHNWLAKRGDTSSVIAITTPEDENIAEKTLALIPNDIPRITISTKQVGPLGTLELYYWVLRAVQQLGDSKGIDPGRPGVPRFGRWLYGLSAKEGKSMQRRSIKDQIKAVHCQRKLDEIVSGDAKDDFREVVSAAYGQYVDRMTSKRFCSIIFDYDGTLVSSEERLVGPREEIREHIKNLLYNNIAVGIATGRGKSVKSDLQKFIPQALQKSVFIGYYNASEILALSDPELPDIQGDVHPQLETFRNKITTAKTLPLGSIVEIRPNQITISGICEKFVPSCMSILRHIAIMNNLDDLKIFNSSHSIDIIPRHVSKLLLVDYLKDNASRMGLNCDVLCIGDKGRYPGNDVELLSTPFSLSVDEISPDLESCWSFARPGERGVEATIRILNALKLNGSYALVVANKLI